MPVKVEYIQLSCDEKQKVNILIRRYNHLVMKIQDSNIPESSQMYNKSERAALAWILGLLNIHPEENVPNQ